MENKNNNYPQIPEHPDYRIYPWVRLAESFVIWQRLGMMYSPEEALMKGTLFPELWRPYKYKNE